MLPFYKMILTEELEGMDAIALVDNPAHMKAFEFFNGKEKKKLKYHFNEEQRIVTGVAIAVDLPIYRNDEEIGEHYVVFDKKETFAIARKMFENRYLHNVNEMHDSNKAITGMILVESYFIDSKKGKNGPDSFKSQNLKDGSWVVSYFVKDDSVWEDIKSGKHIGFSIEGWFDKRVIKTKYKKQSKMKKTGNLFKKVFGKEETFAEAQTVDGETIVWEGDLAEGVELKLKTEEGEVLAPEGSHSIVNEDGSSTVITVDGNGKVVTVEEVEAEGGDEEEALSADEVAEVIKAMEEKLNKANDERFKKIEAKNVELEKSNTELKAENVKFGNSAWKVLTDFSISLFVKLGH